MCSCCGHRSASRYDKRLCRVRDLWVAGWRLHVEFERWRVEAQDHRQLPATATRKRQIAPTLIREDPNLGMMCKLITERTR